MQEYQNILNPQFNVITALPIITFMLFLGTPLVFATLSANALD